MDTGHTALCLEQISRNTHTGRPLGSAEFTRSLEMKLRRHLAPSLGLKRRHRQMTHRLFWPFDMAFPCVLCTDSGAVPSVPASPLRQKSYGESLVESHISRKRSEMWGTRRSLHGNRVERDVWWRKALINVSACVTHSTSSLCFSAGTCCGEGAGLQEEN